MKGVVIARGSTLQGSKRGRLLRMHSDKYVQCNSGLRRVEGRCTAALPQWSQFCRSITLGSALIGQGVGRM